MDQVPSPVSSPAPTLHPHHNVLLPSDNSKILQNVLYGKGYSNYPYASVAGLYHPMLYDDPFRPRSGSLQSLGSTASSHRQDRSPSRESTSSHESLHLRASPISLPEENPSPLCSTAGVGSESKLFNILKGNVASPFSNMFESTKPQYFSSQPSFQVEQHLDPAVNESGSSTFRRHEPYPVVKRFLETNDEDGPIDLSYRSKKSRNESLAPRRYTMPAEYSSKAALIRARIAARNAKLESTLVRPAEESSSSPIPFIAEDNTEENEEISGNSILKTILSGNSKRYSSIFFLAKDSERHSLSAPASPATYSYSEPASPLAGFATPPLSDDQNPRVTIAKKTLFPVRGRVTDWVQKTVDFAKTIGTFTSLSEDDQLTLLLNTWAKILLINMAENNFEFAVTPVSKDPEPGEDNSSQEQPTMKSVERIQSFIKKCQNIGLDSREYECVKSAILFHIGANGVSKRQLIEDTSIKCRKELQDYIKVKNPCDLMRYSNILLLLHTLSGINCTMVQNLFCRHIVDNETMAEYIKKLLKQGRE